MISLKAVDSAVLKMDNNGSFKQPYMQFFFILSICVQYTEEFFTSFRVMGFFTELLKNGKLNVN